VEGLQVWNCLRSLPGLVARLQAAMTTVDANMYPRVRVNAVRALPSALKWTEAVSSICSNYEAPMVWSFVTVYHFTATSILKTIRHMIYVV
jgi:hypothetical protein